MLIPSHGNNFIFPYNPIYDYNENVFQNCLVLMFIGFESEGKIYPVLFDYWISNVYYENKEDYISKNELFINSIKYIISKGLLVENILLDGGFFNKNILQEVSEIGLNIITRCSKSRFLEIQENKIKAKDVFLSDYNGSFYYYHKYGKFLNQKDVLLYGLEGKLVGICNNRDDLLNKKLFFIFSTNRKYTSPEILKLYKLRWKIESFFKILKSYLGLSVLNRNDIDYVEERINLSLSGFFIVQEMAFEIKSSFYQTLKLLKSGELNELFDKTYKSVCKYFSYCV